MTIKLKHSHLKKANKVSLSGAAMLYLANVIKDRHIALIMAVAQATEAGMSAKKISDLMDTADANEAMGAMVLGWIAESYGEDIMDAFIDGSLDFDDVKDGLDKMSPNRNGAPIN